jgi:hypothetical protein
VKLLSHVPTVHIAFLLNASRTTGRALVDGFLLKSIFLQNPPFAQPNNHPEKHRDDGLADVLFAQP